MDECGIITQSNDDFDSEINGCDISSRIKNILHEFYLRECSEKMKAVKLEMMKRGKRTGGKVLFGYKYIDGKYEINDIEAEEIRLIYRLYEKEKNYAQTARLLNKMKKQTPSGGYEWTGNSVRRIIKEEKYRGKRIVGKTRLNRLGKREKGCWLEIENGIPPIIQQ